MNAHGAVMATLVAQQRDEILKAWLASTGGGAGRGGALQATEAATLIDAVREGLQQSGDLDDFQGTPWQATRDTLADLSASRAAQGASSAATSQFVLALKRPVFAALQRHHVQDPQAALDAFWSLSNLVDAMAQHTVSTYQKTREEVIARQQAELLELSTPVVKLWDGVLAVPMIGTLDSGRTQLVMQALLERIVESGSELAIIDITGVPTVDTLVAQHLLKTVAAIRLMGADCIISGIRPQIAQTIVHLGIDLQGITTKATLADALRLAMQRNGFVITRAAAGA